jgi:hypothetical protein
MTAVSMRVATCQPMFATNVLVNCDYVCGGLMQLYFGSLE